jgi:ribosomal-protein-alanine N-acetyltransferase
MAAEPPRVRPGTPSDVRRLAELERLTAINPWPLEQFVYSSLRDNQGSLVLEGETGEVLGFAIFQQVLDEVTLMNIAVHPEYQGRGHGRRLLVALLQELVARGVARCLLEVRRSNTAAQALYRAQGFVDDGVRSNYYPTADGREDALLMSLELASDS